MNENDIQKFIQGIGVIAEITLCFYKAVIGAGGTIEEATMLSKVALQVLLVDIPSNAYDSGKKKDEEE